MTDFDLKNPYAMMVISNTYNNIDLVENAQRFHHRWGAKGHVK